MPGPGSSCFYMRFSCLAHLQSKPRGMRIRRIPQWTSVATLELMDFCWSHGFQAEHFADFLWSIPSLDPAPMGLVTHCPAFLVMANAPVDPTTRRTCLGSVQFHQCTKHQQFMCHCINVQNELFSSETSPLSDCQCTLSFDSHLQ